MQWRVKSTDQFRYESARYIDISVNVALVSGLLHKANWLKEGGMKRTCQFFKNLVLAGAIGLVVLAPIHASAASKLIVNGPDGTTPKFVVGDSGSILTTNAPDGTTARFTVTDLGFIGLGTSTPNSAISVVKDAVIDAQINTRVIADINSGGGGFTGYHNRATLGSNNGLPLNGDRLGYFYFGSLSPFLDQFGKYIPLNGAGIAAKAEGDFTITYDAGAQTATAKSMPSAFAFETAPAGSLNRIERLRITSSATVGINTNAPQATLDVSGGLRINPSYTLGVNGVDNHTKPTCTDANRGTLWFTQGAGSAKDLLEICASDGTAAGWRALY